MADRSEFLEKIAGLDLAHVERAIALLWFYRQTQQFDERTASDLSRDLKDEGLPKSNVTRLHDDLRRSKYTVAGKRPRTFQIDLRRVAELNGKYERHLAARVVTVTGSVIPPAWVAGTRLYLEKLVYQINGAYDYGFYDACAVLCRRLMESLIIDCYLAKGIDDEIKDANGAFLQLAPLITKIKTNKAVALGRHSPKTMDALKSLGDTAAHDRTYITPAIDIDDARTRVRQLISELLDRAGIKPPRALIP